MTVQEHLLALVQIRPTEPPARRRQPHHEQRQLGQHPGQIDVDRAEVDLGLRAQRMVLGDHHLDQRHRLPTADLSDIAAHRRLTHRRRRAPRPDAATPAAPCDAACAAPSVSASSQPSIVGFHRIQHRRRPHRPACASAAPPTTTPPAHRGDAHRTGPPAPGSTAARARVPCGSARRAPPSTFGPCAPRSGAPTRSWWTPRAATGGAKSDEHYRPRWGQIR